MNQLIAETGGASGRPVAMLVCGGVAVMIILAYGFYKWSRSSKFGKGSGDSNSSSDGDVPTGHGHAGDGADSGGGDGGGD